MAVSRQTRSWKEAWLCELALRLNNRKVSENTRRSSDHGHQVPAVMDSKPASACALELWAPLRGWGGGTSALPGSFCLFRPKAK